MAVPTEQEQLKARHVTSQQIVKLEDLWRDNAQVTIDDLERPGLDEEPAPVQLRFDIFNPGILTRSSIKTFSDLWLKWKQIMTGN